MKNPETLKAPFALSDAWPSLWLWTLLIFVGALDAVWVAATPLRFDSSGLGYSLFSALVLFLFSIAGWRKLPSRMLLFMMGAAFVLCAWPALRVFNHLVMTVPLPLTDSLLANWDADLGLNWRYYVFWVDGHPWLVRAMNFTYVGLTMFSCCAFVILIGIGDTRAAHEFLVLFFSSAVIASVVGAFFPAYTTMFYYSPVQQMLHNISPNYGVSFAPYLDEIRSNPKHVLHLANLPGLTAFPSFHTAMALITVYCSRTRVVLFVPALVFNSLMIASTPVFGGHYFVDLIAGGALAMVLIAFMKLPYAELGETLLSRCSKLAGTKRSARAY